LDGSFEKREREKEQVCSLTKNTLVTQRATCKLLRLEFGLDHVEGTTCNGGDETCPRTRQGGVVEHVAIPVAVGSSSR